VAGSTRRWRLVWSALASIAIVAGAVAVVAVVVVRAVLLDSATYTTALARTDAHERVYTEILADPELAELKEALLGDVGVPAELAVQARALGVNVLRWTVPPSTLGAWTDTVIAGALGYVRGDTDRLDAAVVVDDVAARVPEMTIREVRVLLADAADRSVASLPALEQALGELVDELTAGRVPATIPVLGGTSFDAALVADAIVEATADRVDAELRQAVLATLLAGDQRDAVIDAASVAVAGHATVAAGRLRAEPAVDVVAVVAERASRPAAQVVGTLDTVRDIARWFRPWTAVAGVALGAGGAAALLVVHRRDRRLAVGWIAGALGAAAVVVAVTWLVVRATVAAPLAPATSAGAGSWGLPPGVRAVLGDVLADVAGRLNQVVWRAVAILAVGAALLAWGGAVGRLARTVPVRRVALLGGGIVAVALVIAVVGSRPRDAVACNGHVELCDRRYDEVTTAATHNSMSAPDIVPVWPEHDGGLTAQLDAGIRTLLMDTHHWPPLESADQLIGAAAGREPRLPPALADALYRQVITVRDGRPGAFLCHNHCAFGAQPLGDGLGEIRDFLARNPSEVVTLIIQDAISPAETAAAFDAAGLGPYVFPQRSGRPWPTLGEMIERGHRLVVFAEEEGPPPDWYANAFEAMQETPFLFLSPDAFSCVENRGDPNAPLFLMNHWVQRIAPDRADSVRVNRLDVLVDRARECERERGLRPTYLAVNFYDIGDVVAAADVLNGVGP
jgi:hypothetical protein